MKKCITILICIFILFSLNACGGMSISSERYDEISNYVLENRDTLLPEKELEFFDYKTAGLSVGGVYYGYYYTVDDEIVVPDFYSGDHLGEPYEADGGRYFGKPNHGTDWCFIKEITNHWYYYELHWG